MAVMTGIDPHKGWHTAVAVGAAEEPLDNADNKEDSICVGDASLAIFSRGAPIRSICALMLSGFA